MDSFISKLTGDRRSAHRHQLKVPLRYRIRRASASERLSESDNISELGVSFSVKEPLSIGAEVDLLVEMPLAISDSASSPWLCMGRIVRVDTMGPDGGRVGVQFTCYEILRTQQQFANHWRPWPAAATERSQYPAHSEEITGN